MKVPLREAPRDPKVGRPLHVEFDNAFFDDGAFVVFQVVFRQKRTSKPVVVQTIKGIWAAVFKGKSPIDVIPTAPGFYTAQMYGPKKVDGVIVTVTYQPARLIHVVA